jgi:hypothetical protein
VRLPLRSAPRNDNLKRIAQFRPEVFKKKSFIVPYGDYTFEKVLFSNRRAFLISWMFSPIFPFPAIFKSLNRPYLKIDDLIYGFYDVIMVSAKAYFIEV